jgi:hypothetical protein
MSGHETRDQHLRFQGRFISLPSALCCGSCPSDHQALRRRSWIAWLVWHRGMAWSGKYPRSPGQDSLIRTNGVG